MLSRYRLPLLLLALAWSAPMLAQAPLALESLGGPEGGYPWALLVEDDGHILAGTYDGGSSAFRSRDGGATWTHVDGLSADRIHGFVRASDGTLFAARTSGVSRSLDGGETWTALSNTGIPWGIYAIVLDEEERIYVATNREGIFRSTDGGDTWASANNGLDTLAVYNLAHGPSGRLYAGGGDGRVHVSVDGGDTWTPAYAGLPAVWFRDLFVTTRGHAYAATHEGLYRSTDGGTSWQAVTAGLPTSNRRMYTLAELPSGRLLASTYAVAHWSDDGGDSWAASDARLPGIYDLATNASGQVFAATFGGGVFRSDDGGSSWVAINSGFVNPDMGGLGFDLEGRLLVGVQQTSPAAFRWDPASSAWQNLYDAGIRSSRAHTWHRTQQDVLLAGTGSGLYRSDDGGMTWARSTELQRTVYSLAETPSGDLFAGTFDEGIARSRDGGVTWTYLSTPLTRTTELVAAPDGTLYAGLDNISHRDVTPGVIRSTDGGDTWTYVNEGIATEPRRIRDLALDAEGRLYATFVGASGPFRSDDRGETWSDIGGSLSSYPMQLAADAQGNLYTAQRDGRIYSTPDGGTSWQALVSEPTGLFPQALSVGPDGRLYLGARGRGVFRSATAVTVSAEGPPATPAGLSLATFPNPVRQVANVEITLDRPERVQIEVYDLLGRRLAVRDAGPRAAGVHRLPVDASAWPAGLYFARVTAGDRTSVARIVKAD